MRGMQVSKPNHLSDKAGHLQVGRSIPNLESETVRVYFIDGSRNSLDISTGRALPITRRRLGVG